MELVSHGGRGAAEKQLPCETSRDGQAAAVEFGQHHVDNAAVGGGDRTSGSPGPRAGAVSTGYWQQAVSASCSAALAERCRRISVGGVTLVEIAR